MTTWLATHRGLRALSLRETARVLKLWTQTILAPILSSALFIIVFGLSLGNRIREIDGFPYEQYIVPGLIAMSMAQAAYANNSSSVFQARFDRYIHNVLASPMRAWEVNFGLNLGGAVRAGLIGAGLLAIAVPLRRRRRASRAWRRGARSARPRRARGAARPAARSDPR